MLLLPFPPVLGAAEDDDEVADGFLSAQPSQYFIRPAATFLLHGQPGLP